MAAYALIEFIEAVGLWLMKRWGEYFAVVATGVFLPLEIYELTEKVTVLRLGALVINLAAVIWLLWSKRLFGHQRRRRGLPRRASHREPAQCRAGRIGCSRCSSRARDRYADGVSPQNWLKHRVNELRFSNPTAEEVACTD